MLNKLKVVAVIQARMGSTRLPGKVLAEVAGVPMLWHVVNRARTARYVDLVLVATSREPADDAIAAFCARNGIECFRGSESDVLDRYYEAAREYQAEIVVRLTADCPLLDPEVIDDVIYSFREYPADYASNVRECTFPDGLDTEAFSFDVLEQAWREARLKSEREHVTPYIRNHPELFYLVDLHYDEDLSALRWTVDEPRDLEFVRAVYSHLGASSAFGMEEVLDLLRERPEISEINAGIGRNEGYQKSLREDGMITGLEER
ncbi:MAG: glycosyltransferase family protein [Chloroflexi bacterium]|nr:glycosyltransferase family protein [Chloroflexota bacterium]